MKKLQRSGKCKHKYSAQIEKKDTSSPRCCQGKVQKSFRHHGFFLGCIARTDLDGCYLPPYKVCSTEEIETGDTEII